MTLHPSGLGLHLLPGVEHSAHGVVEHGVHRHPPAALRANPTDLHQFGDRVITGLEVVHSLEIVAAQMHYLADPGDLHNAIPEVVLLILGVIAVVADLVAAIPGRDEQAEAQREPILTPEVEECVVVGRLEEQATAIVDPGESVRRELARHRRRSALRLFVVNGEREQGRHSEGAHAEQHTGGCAVGVTLERTPRRDPALWHPPSRRRRVRQH